MGLACALGTDAVAACAAARAGLSRPQPLPGRVVVDPESGEAVPVIGHPVSHLTRGFAGAGLLARIAALALRNLASRTELSARDFAETPLVLALGSGYYLNAAERIEEERPIEDALPPEVEQSAEWKESVARMAVPRMFAHAQLQAPRRAELLFQDHAAFGAALHRAAEVLEEPGVRQCLVGAVDSYCDPDVLEALATLGALATPENPVGLAPGEGAAFLIVERVASRRAIALLGAPGIVTGGPHALAPGGGASCTRLAHAIDEALGNAAEPRCAMSMGTHSGSSWSAAEWGRALVAVPRWANETRHVFPAVSFGDTGAAASALATCASIHAFARGYAGGDAVMVWASSPAGAKAAFVVTQPRS